MKYLLLCSLVVVTSAQLQFTFDSDLEGWVVDRDKWYWANRQMIPNILPNGVEDGFATFDENMESDELYWPRVSAPYGGRVTFTFFVRSQGQDTNDFKLQKSYDYLSNSFTINDFDEYIFPYNNQFQTLTIELEADPEIFYIGFFCYNSQKAEVGDWFQGCLIDSITVESYNETTTIPPTTPTPTTPEPTTPEPTTPEPTTPEPTTPEPTTPEPTTPEPTTPEPTTPEPTTPEPTTPEPTTPEPTTPEPTTPEPTTPEPTTPEPTTLEPTTPEPTTPEPTTPKLTTLETTTMQPTTMYPPDTIIFNFQNGMDGWTLSHMNGAFWIRTLTDASMEGPGIPSAGPYILEVKPAEQYSATTLAQSPYLIAKRSNLVISVKFWMQGTNDFPCQLKLRKRTGIESFDILPIMNLDSFGDTPNNDWITYSVETGDAFSTGEAFFLIFEGSLGGRNSNRVYLSEIIIEGVEIDSLSDSGAYDFENGLAGFSSGNMDGARWSLFNWNTEGGSDMGIPKPINGNQILVVEKYDTHSGVVTIETPPIKVENGSTKEVYFKYWTRGSNTYPVALRVRAKTNGGRYQIEPFINLVDNGEVAHNYWISYSNFYTLELPGDAEYLQLVLEADLGNDMNNAVAIDDLEILST